MVVDLIKTRMQLMQPGTGFLTAAGDIIRSDGVGRMYNGLSAGKCDHLEYCDSIYGPD